MEQKTQGFATHLRIVACSEGHFHVQAGHGGCIRVIDSSNNEYCLEEVSLTDPEKMTWNTVAGFYSYADAKEWVRLIASDQGEITKLAKPIPFGKVGGGPEGEPSLDAMMMQSIFGKVGGGGHFH